MEQNYHSTLTRLKSQAERERLVTPAFLQVRRPPLDLIRARRDHTVHGSRSSVC